MRGKTERIDKILENVFLKTGLTKNIQLNQIQSIISSCLDEYDHNHLRIGYIKNRKLYLYVDSSSYLYEIKCFKKNSILEKLKENTNINISDICLILDNKEKC